MNEGALLRGFQAASVRLDNAKTHHCVNAMLHKVIHVSSSHLQINITGAGSTVQLYCSQVSSVLLLNSANNTTDARDEFYFHIHIIYLYNEIL